ncbi:unnamed protein product, partial [Prorocentrum cordatum]
MVEAERAAKAEAECKLRADVECKLSRLEGMLQEALAEQVLSTLEADCKATVKADRSAEHFKGMLQEGESKAQAGRKLTVWYGSVVPHAMSNEAAGALQQAELVIELIFGFLQSEPRRRSEESRDTRPEATMAFLAIPGYSSYTPQSSQIFGILETLLEDFKANLADAQAAEEKSVADFEALKKAKEE